MSNAILDFFAPEAEAKPDPIKNFFGSEEENLRQQAGIQKRIDEYKDLLRNSPEEQNPAVQATKFIYKHSVPVVSAVGGLLSGQGEISAGARVAEGKGTQADYMVVAREQLESERQAGLTTAGKIGEGLAGIPAIVGEAAMTGGGSLFATPAKSLLGRAAQYGATKAAQTPFMPSLYAHSAVESAKQKGGNVYDPQNLGPAYVHGVLTNIVLGSVGEAAAGIKNPVSRFLAKTGIGMAEMEAVNDATTLLDTVFPEVMQFKTDYGPLGTFLDGRKGEALQKATVDAVVFAAFTTLHGNRYESHAKPAPEKPRQPGTDLVPVERRPGTALMEPEQVVALRPQPRPPEPRIPNEVLVQFRKTFESLKRQGLSEKVIGEKMMEIGRRLNAAVEVNPALTRAEAQALFANDKGALRDLGMAFSLSRPDIAGQLEGPTKGPFHPPSVSQRPVTDPSVLRTMDARRQPPGAPQAPPSAPQAAPAAPAAPPTSPRERVAAMEARHLDLMRQIMDASRNEKSLADRVNMGFPDKKAHAEAKVRHKELRSELKRLERELDAARTEAARQPPEPPQAAPTVEPAAPPAAPEIATQTPAPEVSAPPVESPVLEATQKSFPSARQTPRGEIEAEVGGRKLFVGHDAERNVARIDFEGEKPGVPADLQKGSLELMRGIRSLVKDLAAQGVGIEYRAVDTTRGVYKKGRADLYAKHLKESGYEQVSEEGGVFLWRPKAETPAPAEGQVFTPEHLTETGKQESTPAMDRLGERFARGEPVEMAEVYEAAGLNARQRHVIEQRLMGRTLEEIGRDPEMQAKKGAKQLTRERIRQIEEEARAKLGVNESVAKAIYAEERAGNSIRLMEDAGGVVPADLHADPEAPRKVRERLTKREQDLDTAADEWIKAAEEAKASGASEEEIQRVARLAVEESIREYEREREANARTPEGVRGNEEARTPEKEGSKPEGSGEAASGEAAEPEIVLTDAQKKLQKRIAILPREAKQILQDAVLKERMSPETIMELADEIRASESVGVEEYNALLKEARDWLGKAGKTIGFSRVEEPGQIRGFDEAATAMAERYPTILGSNPEQKLFDLLKKGNLKPPTMAEAIKRATEQIREGSRPREFTEEFREEPREETPLEESFDDSFDFGANIEPKLSPVEQLEALTVRHSQDPYRTRDQLRADVLEILKGMNQAELEATTNQFLGIVETAEPIKPAAERLPPEKGGFTPEERAALDRMMTGDHTPADASLLDQWLERANKIMEQTRAFFREESGALDIDAFARKGRELLERIREWQAIPEKERGPSPLAERRTPTGKRTIQLTPYQKRLLDMHQQGMGTSEIARKVGIKRTAAISTISAAKAKLAGQARDASELTPVEEHVLALRAVGLTLREIADLRGIRHRATVKGYERRALAKLKEAGSMKQAAEAARQRDRVAAMFERLDAGVQPATILDQLILQEEASSPSGEPTRIATTRAQGRAEMGRMSAQFDLETGARLEKVVQSEYASRESSYNSLLDSLVEKAEAAKAAGASQAEIDAIFASGPSLEEYRAERRNRRSKAKGARGTEEGGPGSRSIEAGAGEGTRFSQGTPEKTSQSILETAQRLIADESGAVDFQRLYRTVRDYLNKRSAAPFGRPIKVDSAHPNPRLQPREISKQIYATPRGAGRIPVLGRLLDPRAAADDIQVALITREGEVKFGESFAELTRHTLPTPKSLIAGPDGKIPLADGTRDFPSDVAEREYARPGSQPLLPEQREWLRRQKVLLDDNVAMASEEGVSKFVDENGVAIPLKEYSPRLAIGKQDLPPPTAGGSSRPGATPGSMKHRHYATEAEGYAAGVRYHPDMGVRLAKRLADGYKAVADHRLATDPVLQGESFNKYKWLEKHRTVSAPAFRMRIFPREIADRLDQWYGERVPKIGRTIDAANALQKGLQFTGDVSNFTVQLMPLMWRHPKQWWAAVTGGAKALVDPAFQSKYLSVPENAAAANALIQSGSGRGYVDYMMGLKPGEVLTQIPVAGRAFEAFGRLFTASTDVAKIELWKKLAPSFKPQEYAELAEHIDNAVGVGRMETIGVRPVRAMAERLMFLAPTYYRSQANLIGEAFQRGATGRQTRQLLGVMAMGTIGSAALAMKFLAGLDDEEIADRMNPSNGRFLKVPVELADGSRVEVGFGGMLMSLVRLAGDLADSKDSDHPLNTGVHNNQILRWIRNHSSATVGLGLDLFMGEEHNRTPGDVGKLALKRGMPLTGQKVLGEGSFQQKGADALFSFLGLNSYPESENNVYYRALEQEAQKKGKKYRDLSLPEMARAVRAVKRSGITKPPATESQRMAAVRAQEDRQKSLMRQLSPETLERLEEVGVQVPAYNRTISVNGVEIPLTDEQTEIYERLLVEEYDRWIGQWKMAGLKQASESVLKRRMELARARAKTRLRAELSRRRREGAVR